MNVYEKIVADISPYFSTPCTVKFKNCFGDTYIGFAESIDGFYCKVPRQKKAAIPGGTIRFAWMSRVRMVRGLLGETYYIPVDKIKIQPPFELPLTLVESTTQVVAGIQNLLLVSRATGKEEFIISKDTVDLERLKKWYADNI